MHCNWIFLQLFLLKSTISLPGYWTCTIIHNFHQFLVFFRLLPYPLILKNFQGPFWPWSRSFIWNIMLQTDAKWYKKHIWPIYFSSSRDITLWKPNQMLVGTYAGQFCAFWLVYFKGAITLNLIKYQEVFLAHIAPCIILVISYAQFFS